MSLFEFKRLKIQNRIVEIEIIFFVVLNFYQKSMKIITKSNKFRSKQTKIVQRDYCVKRAMSVEIFFLNGITHIQVLMWLVVVFFFASLLSVFFELCDSR